MKTRILKQTCGSALIVIAALTVAFSFASAQEAEQTLQGVWRVTRMGIDCQTREPFPFSFPAIMTFNQGGTYTGYGLGPGETPATSSPEYGYWLNGSGPRTYSIKFLGYSYEPNGAFAGWGEVTATAQVAIGGNSLTYDSTIKVFDADGNLLFSGCGRATGTRFE